jgi:hypothetical protein
MTVCLCVTCQYRCRTEKSCASLRLCRKEKSCLATSSIPSQISAFKLVRSVLSSQTTPHAVTLVVTRVARPAPLPCRRRAPPAPRPRPPGAPPTGRCRLRSMPRMRTGPRFGSLNEKRQFFVGGGPENSKRIVAACGAVALTRPCINYSISRRYDTLECINW